MSQWRQIKITRKSGWFGILLMLALPLVILTGLETHGVPNVPPSLPPACINKM